MDRIDYLDSLLSLPSISDPKISPDSKWIAWTWYRVGPASDVFALPVDSSDEPLRLTQTPENTTLVSWTKDSKGLIVAEDKGGSERVQLFLVKLSQPLEMVPLTEPDPHFFIRDGELHPNGRWLFYGANYDPQSKKEIEPAYLLRKDLETGELITLAKPERGGEFQLELNSQGTHLIYSRSDLHPAGAQIYLVDVEGIKDEEILNFGPKAKIRAHWLPSGKEIVFLTEEGTKNRMGIWSLHDHKIRWLKAEFNYYLEDLYPTPLDNYLVLLGCKEARMHPVILNPSGNEEKEMALAEGNFIPLTLSSDGSWVGIFYSSQEPSDLVQLDPSSLNLKRSLLKVWERTKLKKKDLFPAQDFRWKSTDGLEIQGWLYQAKGEAKGTIVYVHGGPTSHSEDKINVLIQFLVHEGFNVLDPNYRGSTGFSLEFREKIKEVGFGGREQEDIRSGIEELIKLGIAKKGKVGIVGTSYGGYSSFWAITHFPLELVKAAVPICGMTDLVLDYETTRPDLRSYSEEMMGGSPQEIPQKYFQRSPINFVSQIKGKLLIVQGKNDPNVTPLNAEKMETALKAQGIDFELLEFPDEGHGISKPHNQRVLYPKIADFFARAFEES